MVAREQLEDNFCKTLVKGSSANAKINVNIHLSIFNLSYGIFKWL